VESIDCQFDILVIVCSSRVGIGEEFCLKLWKGFTSHHLCLPSVLLSRVYNSRPRVPSPRNIAICGAIQGGIKQAAVVQSQPCGVGAGITRLNLRLVEGASVPIRHADNRRIGHEPFCRKCVSFTPEAKQSDVNGANSLITIVASTQGSNILLECPQDSCIPIIWRWATVSVIEWKILKVQRQSKWLSRPVDKDREDDMHLSTGAPFQQAVENCPIEQVISDHDFIQSQVIPFHC
jgi:hypothetical protein